MVKTILNSKIQNSKIWFTMEENIETDTCPSRNLGRIPPCICQALAWASHQTQGAASTAKRQIIYSQWSRSSIKRCFLPSGPEALSINCTRRNNFLFLDHTSHHLCQPCTERSKCFLQTPWAQPFILVQSGEDQGGFKFAYLTFQRSKTHPSSIHLSTPSHSCKRWRR